MTRTSPSSWRLAILGGSILALSLGLGCRKPTETHEPYEPLAAEGTSTRVPAAAESPVVSHTSVSDAAVGSPCPSLRPDPSLLSKIRVDGVTAEATFVTPDPSRADPDRVLAASIALQSKLTPNAELRAITFHGVVNPDGTLPLLLEKLPQLLECDFIRRLPVSRPGADTVERVGAGLVAGHLHAGLPGLTHWGEWEPPCCPIRQVFRAVVASGVPKEAIIRATYEASQRDYNFWRVSVNDHPEFSRSIDGRTCQVRSADGGF
jgi:hypothetical protein